MTKPGTFVCTSCLARYDAIEANLDAADNLICNACWVANPPEQDVQGIFAEVVAHAADLEVPAEPPPRIDGDRLP